MANPIVSTRAAKGNKSSQTIATADWLCGDDSLDIINALAKKLRGLSMNDADDLGSEIVLAILEAKTMPKDAKKQTEWLEKIAHDTACRLRNTALSQPKAMDGEVMAEVFAAYDDEPEYEFETCEELARYERNLKARVKRAVSKLSKDQQQVINDKFFQGKALSTVASDKGMCDSSHRMRLLRAKAKLKSMINSSGYALKA